MFWTRTRVKPMRFRTYLFDAAIFAFLTLFGWTAAIFYVLLIVLPREMIRRPRTY